MLESEEWVWLYSKMDPYSDGTVNVFTVQKTHEYTLVITHNTVYIDTHTNDNTEWQSNSQRGDIHVNALIGLHKSFIKCYHTKCTGVFLNYSFNHTWIYKITSIKSPIKQTPQYLANGFYPVSFDPLSLQVTLGSIFQSLTLTLLSIYQWDPISSEEWP